MQELKLNKAITAAPTNIFFMDLKFITSETMEVFLSTFDLGGFLSKNGHLSPQTFLLSHKGNENSYANLLADQLKVYKKAIYKLPVHCQHFCWFSSKSYEQASSEASALLKSKLFPAKTVLDLSGGLGIDDWAFAKAGAQVTSVDPDEMLNKLVIANNKKTGSTSISRITQTAEAFLENFSERIDLVYLDADRREAEKRVSLKSNGKPDYFELEKKLHEIAEKIVLKLSPLVDLTACERELSYLSKIAVVSLNYEVKEILCCIEPKFSGKPGVEIFELNEQGEVLFSISSETLKAIQIFEELGSTETCFFEARPALIKSGFAMQFAKQLGFESQNQNGTWFIGSNLQSSNEHVFRAFHLVNQGIFKKNEFIQYLKSNQIKKAHVKCREIGISVDEFRKQYKIADGGEDYFFVGKSLSGEKTWFHCRKINPEQE